MKVLRVPNERYYSNPEGLSYSLTDRLYDPLCEQACLAEDGGWPTWAKQAGVDIRALESLTHRIPRLIIMEEL